MARLVHKIDFKGVPLCVRAAGATARREIFRRIISDGTGLPLALRVYTRGQGRVGTRAENPVPNSLQHHVPGLTMLGP